jgi:DNA repair protein endonuclease SAE2/CtIP C-terminus
MFRQASAGSGAPAQGTQQVAPLAPGGYAYDERVRKRSDRAALPAWECAECARFYAALQVQGSVSVPGLKCTACARDRGGPGMSGPSTAVPQMLAGRHRSRFVAPPTPKNYWDIGFHDDAVKR